jgi:hypothetical protein
LHRARLGVRRPQVSSAEENYSSSLPTTLPVVGLTRCTCRPPTHRPRPSLACGGPRWGIERGNVPWLNVATIPAPRLDWIKPPVQPGCSQRYPTRASELDHQVPPSPLHDPSPNQLHAGERGERSRCLTKDIRVSHPMSPRHLVGGRRRRTLLRMLFPGAGERLVKWNLPSPGRPYRHPDRCPVRNALWNSQEQFGRGKMLRSSPYS